MEEQAEHTGLGVQPLCRVSIVTLVRSLGMHSPYAKLPSVNQDASKGANKGPMHVTTSRMVTRVVVHGHTTVAGKQALSLKHTGLHA